MQPTLWQLAAFCAFFLSHTNPQFASKTEVEKRFLSLNECHQEKSSSVSSNRDVLPIIHVFSKKGSASTDPIFKPQSLYVAFQMAIEDVNALTKVFPHYVLKPTEVTNDTISETQTILNIMTKLEKTTDISFLIDATGSDLVLKMETLLTDHKVVQIATIFGHQAVLPYMSRMEPPADYVASVFVKLFQTFNWTKIWIITQIFEDYQLSASNIMGEFSDSNISVVHIQKLQQNVSIESSVLTLKEKKARVILGLMDEAKARDVLCAAYKLGLYGKKVAWVMFSMNYQSTWWKIQNTSFSCSQKQMDEAAEGLFYAEIATSGENTSISGQTQLQFWASYRARFKNELDIDQRAPQVYDSVWAVALTMNCLLSKKILLELSTHALNRKVAETMQNMTFMGIRGPVSFKDGSPLVRVWVNQIQKGCRKQVVLFDPLAQGNGLKTKTDTPIFWPTGSPTKDSMTKRNEDHKLLDTLYIGVCVLGAAGIVLACVLLIYNVTRSNERVVRMSSPRLNYVILLGCMCVYACVFIKEISAEHERPGCYAYSILLHLGLAMTLSGVLVKVWRVYVIFTDIRIRQGDLSDFRLLIIVAAVSGVAVLFSVVWAVFDPVYLTKNEKNTCETSMLEETDEVVEKCEKMCTSKFEVYKNYAQLGAVTTTLVLGTFLAWQTRHVHIRELNESKELALCVYSLVVLVVLYVLLWLARENSVNLKYGMRSALLIVGATAVQGFIFLPRLTSYRRTVPSVNRESLRPAIPGRPRTKSLSSPHLPDVQESLGTSLMQSSSFQR